MIMKKIVKPKILIKSRHIEWNLEKSPDRENCVRYHFVIVGDKGRERTVNKILLQIQKIGSIQIIREIEGKVAGSDFRYFFGSYDTEVAFREIELSKISLQKMQNSELYERKGKLNIEDYVAERFAMD